jgi:hypothetical protein
MAPWSVAFLDGSLAATEAAPDAIDKEKLNGLDEDLEPSLDHQ